MHGLKSVRQAISKAFRTGSYKTLVTILGLASLFTPIVAEASVLSFFSGLFGASDVSAQQEITSPNVQNMALLQAAISPNQNATTSSPIAIVSGTSLSPESVAPTPTLSPNDTKTIDDDQISLYVVHDGDTLPAIAKMFNVSVNTIRWGNNLKGNTITVGQTLVILPISGVEHTVKSGDTLQSIAKQHNGNVDDILQYNNLTKDSKLAVGDVIIVPDGEASGGTSYSNPSSSSGSNSINVSCGSFTISPRVGTYGPNCPVHVGYYERPIEGGVKSQGIHGHNAVDLAAPIGTPIMAAADGVVILSRTGGWNGGYGTYVVINHSNGTQTVYGHMSQNLVSVGEHVSQGQTIGAIGMTGNTTGPHVHFEIRGARNPF